MYAKLLSIVTALLLSSVAFGQISYSYVDPCTGVTKTISVPSSGVTVTYYGEINTFQPNDFYNGTFEAWAQGVYGSFGGNNPCASVVGLPTGINIAQGTTLNFLSIVNSLSAVQDLAGGGSTDILSGVQNTTRTDKKEKNGNGNSSNSSVSGNSNSSNSSQGNNSNGSQNQQGSQNGQGSQQNGQPVLQGGSSGGNTQGQNNNQSNPNGGSAGSSSGQGQQNNGGSGTTQGQQGSGQPGSGSTEGQQGSGQSGSVTPGSNAGGSGSTGNGSTGNTSSSGNTQGGSGGNNNSSNPNSTTEPPKEESGGGKTNIVGSATNNAQAASNKNGNRPNVIASSDFVGFNFKNSDVSYGGKITGGYTSARWDGARAHGVLCDYTSALRGPNISGFYAFIHKKRIDLISTTLTLGFDRKMTVYGTLSFGQMWDLGKQKKAKALYMLTASSGSVFGEPFLGTAAIAGAMYDLKVGKRIDIKLMGLYVYAPYVSYYNDILLKSPHVVLPIIGTNIGVTKKFKLNINGGGAWAIKENALNYTIMMGTRFLL